MRPESRKHIHIGINFLTFPPPVVGDRTYIAFQQSLISNGIQYSTVTRRENQVEVIRESIAPLSVLVGASTPEPIGQLVIVAAEPARPLQVFIGESEAVVKSYESTWPASQRQIIKVDATLRDLYETESEHAFKELWEEWLQQTEDSLAPLGHPVLGGGLRLVMPPAPNDPASPQIEVKIESYLRDTSKFYVETQFVWLQPMPPGQGFDPGIRLNQLDEYVKNQVTEFMTRRPK